MHRNSLSAAIVAGLGAIFGSPTLSRAVTVQSLPWDHNRRSRRRSRFGKEKTRPTWVGAYRDRYESPAGAFVGQRAAQKKAGRA